MKSAKARLLIVFSRHGSDTSTKFGGFVKRIKNNGGFSYADVDYVALEDLIFRIDSQTTASVRDDERGIDVGRYSFVYLKSWQAMPTAAAALAFYLEGAGIPYADEQARGENMSKISNHMAFWAAGVPVAPTIWGSQQRLYSYVETTELEYPCVIKSVTGEKGRDNYVAANRAEALRILGEAHAPMMIQTLIPNDGDYRIGVYGSQARWAIYRRSGGTSHLNNTSAGGSSELLAIDRVDPGVRELAERAAEVCGLAVSGVDVMEHRDTHALYVLEANQGSQIVTGAYTTSNIAAFDEGMRSMVMTARSKRPRRRQIIGRHVDVQLLHAEGAVSIKAKVDTGAYRSAIDVQSYELKTDADGKAYLEYVIAGRESLETRTFHTYDFDQADIKNSAGDVSRRYVVPMELSILGRKYSTHVSLARRHKQKYQMLVGRVLLSGNFLVNVDYSEVED